MSNYKITLPGLEAAANEQNLSLFDFLTLPIGIDKTILTDTIILQSDTFEVLYSDIEFLRYAIGAWGRRNYRTFDKWIKALNIEYSPLENYDRREEWTDAGYRNVKTDDDMTGSSSSSGSEESEDSSSGSGSKENRRSAFNDSTYQNYDKEDSTSSDSGSSSSEFSNTGSTSSNRDIEEKETNGNTRTGRAHGNIGVTTSQQMLESELEIARFNIYNQISDMFINEFIIPVFD